MVKVGYEFIIEYIVVEVGVSSHSVAQVLHNQCFIYNGGLFFPD